MGYKEHLYEPLFDEDIETIYIDDLPCIEDLTAPYQPEESEPSEDILIDSVPGLD